MNLMCGKRRLYIPYLTSELLTMLSSFNSSFVGYHLVPEHADKLCGICFESKINREGYFRLEAVCWVEPGKGGDVG